MAGLGRGQGTLEACLGALAIPHSLRPGFEASRPNDEQDGTSTSSWVSKEVPSKLDTLRAILDDDDTRLDDVYARSGVVVALARFWTPPLRAWDMDDATVEPQTALRYDEELRPPRYVPDEWGNEVNVTRAEGILAHAKLGDTNARLDVAVYLLQHYLRPLFSFATARSTNFDADSGRAKRQDPLLTSRPATMGGLGGKAEAVWKGNVTAASTVDLKLFGSPLTFECEGQERNAALGCWNVLGWALWQLCQVRPETRGSSTAWDEHWPLVLPPLLTLLEDSEPYFRLIGTRLLRGAILDPVEGSGVPASLLLRTNVVPLLMSALETSYTFITSDYGHILLDAALAAARQLAILTTAPIEIIIETDGNGGDESKGDPPSSSKVPKQTWVVQDGGAARAAKLEAILTYGIFKVWSFPVRTAGLGGHTSMRHELVRTTFRWLRLLVLPYPANPAPSPYEDPQAWEGVLGIASARFLGIVCEFVGGWVEREWAGAWALHAPSPQTHPDPSTIAPDLGLSLERQHAAASVIASAEAVFDGAAALLLASSASVRRFDGTGVQWRRSEVDLDVPPGIALWAGRVLLSSARLWTHLHDAGLTRQRGSAPGHEGPIEREARRTRATLKKLWTIYDELAPDVTKKHRDSLVRLDASVFRELCS